MAFPHVWSATEDNQPTGSTPIGQGDDYIVATRQMIRERIGLEHNFDFTNDAEQGSHREGSARVWVSETEPEDPIPAVTAETVGQLKKGRFWFKPSTGEAFVYDLGTAAWKAINITGAQLIGLVTALSAKSTVAAADKILILDSSAGGAGKLITADKFATAAQGVKADAALPASSYTAADVLTKIKTVDGSGTGLDADLLDGQHASAFALASWFTSGVSGLYQGHSIPKESAWTPPAGLYIFYNVDDNISIQISYGSVFLTAVPPGTGGMFLTNGSILRLYNSYENDAITVYYRKLL